MLNIPTKINKGTVEILAPVDLIKKGDKVGSSEAALLAKLGIRPFSYGLVITDVYEDGLVFSREVLDLMDEDLIEKFSSGICMVASLSLAISYPTMAGAAHMFVNGYKNVLAIATETNYSYPHADQIKEYLKDNAETCAEPGATKTGLSELPLDVIEKLLNHISCRGDWARLRCANKFWKAKVDGAKRPMQLPWLILPSTTKPTYYSTDGQAVHRLRLPDSVRRAKRITGAHEGDWILLADDTKTPVNKIEADEKEAILHRNQIYNLSTGRVIPLPQQMSSHGGRVDVEVRVGAIAGCLGSPNGFVVVAIVRPLDSPFERAAYCNQSMELWDDCEYIGGHRMEDAVGNYVPLDDELLDVVHRDGSFYLLTNDEEVVKLVFDRNQIVQPVSGLGVMLRDDLPANRFLVEQGQQIWRYLVPVQTGLLMVIRYIVGRRTERIRVFKLEDKDDQLRWIEQDDLPGHKVFIGHGCSRCYEVGDEVLSIYFYDDREELRMPQYYFRDDSGIATSLEIFPWPVIMGESQIESVFMGESQIESVSERSPPAWWLHKCPRA